MNIRTSKPSNNKFYITTSEGGYSQCIQGKPTDANANVLANCVGYACGRFNEIIGTMKYPSLNCNAENFIERAKAAGLEISNVPTLGGIMVWQKGATLGSSDGAGHVAVVERIDSANQIYTSESGYGSSAFWNSTRTNNNGRWGAGAGYTFRGCIVNPAIGKVTANTNSSKKSNEEIAAEVWAGKWGTGSDRKNRLQAAGYDYNTIQGLVNKGVGKNGGSTSSTSTPSKSALDVAREIWTKGNWGTGAERKRKVEAAGYNYSEVQGYVNQLASGKIK